ncbi:HNH endonuclease [Lyngbya confervoides]|uniref:HNH endonuclease n=1 Tax=Lyngbya confervoides BDU141951 TaxID=1574623 RepID=A0ABD4SZX9_9CYAN|nr:HNH endonuclease [Lyngbya confervoides]MCM1981918.1 HNH endonuclease [Lyngbya confervoides BDU141951]
MNVSRLQPSIRVAKPIVLFSKNYLPITRVNLKRAACLLITGRAEPLNFEGDEWQLRSPRFVLRVPEHIRLTLESAERTWKVPPVNRREVLRRDKNTCQYCGSRKDLTLDHVIPRSRGGQHTWDNVVTACASCNGRKGNQILEHSPLILRQPPRAPRHPVIAFAEQFWKETPPC